MPSLRGASFRRSHKNNVAENHYNSVFINLLNDYENPIEINLTDDMNGDALLESVSVTLGGLLERDYFGLSYIYRCDNKRWLEGTKKVQHQMKKARTKTMSLRVKHYPSNPSEDIVQDLTRYFFYLQLRLDLFSGNLIVKGEPLFKLISLIIQAEYGDILEPTIEELFGVITNLKIVENVNSKMVEETQNVLVTVNGLDTKEAEKQFLILVSLLDSYGVEPYAVMDEVGDKFFLAMNHQGICTFFGEKRKNIFYWENISKMMFVKKTFIFDINIDNKKKRIGYKFHSESRAKEFWKCALDRQYFMTFNNKSQAKKVKSNDIIFRRKVVHCFSGRSIMELNLSCQTLDSVPQPPIVRTHNRTISRSFSSKAICRNSVNLDNENSQTNSFSTIPRRSKANNDNLILSLDYVDGAESKDNQETLTNSDESMLINANYQEGLDNEQDLAIIVEDKAVEEVIESSDIKMVQSLFEGIDIDIKENNIEEVDMEIRERLVEDQVSGTEDSAIAEHHLECNNIDTHFRSQHIDGKFFVKFVVLTTLILLVVMVTSLVAYYYYRSSIIADLNRHKYSSEWNKNIDLESIKRFVLRNDAP